MKSTIYIFLLCVFLLLYILTKLELESIKEFTEYKCIPGVFEYSKGRMLVKDKHRYFYDREYQDSILNLIK